MYPYDPLSYTGGRQLLAGPTIPGRSGASGQTKYSPATSVDLRAREKADGTPLGRLLLALEKLTCTLGMREKKMRAHME